MEDNDLLILINTITNNDFSTPGVRPPCDIQWTEHDGAIKWKHFPRYWPFVRGIHRVTGGFPSQRPVKRSFDVFFDLRLSKQLSKQSRRRLFEGRCCWFAIVLGNMKLFGKILEYYACTTFFVWDPRLAKILLIVSPEEKLSFTWDQQRWWDSIASRLVDGWSVRYIQRMIDMVCVLLRNIVVR